MLLKDFEKKSKIKQRLGKQYEYFVNHKSKT